MASTAPTSRLPCYNRGNSKPMLASQQSRGLLGIRLDYALAYPALLLSTGKRGAAVRCVDTRKSESSLKNTIFSGQSMLGVWSLVTHRCAILLRI
jgi:hypothetical protein